MRHTTLVASLIPPLLLFTSVPAFAQVAVSNFANANGARGLAMDGAGRLYVSTRGVLWGGGSGTPAIRRYSLPSNVATIFADAADGLSDPADMAFDDSGNLFVADYGNGRIHKITPGGTASVAATATNPNAVTRDAAGNIYVGEYFSRRILKIAPGGAVSTYVAQAWPEASYRLTMLHAGPDGSLYAGDLFSTGKIWRIGPGGSPITLFADGLGTSLGMTPFWSGGWLVTTYVDQTIRWLQPDGSHAHFAGTNGLAGTTNGTLDVAQFGYPSAIIYSPSEARYYIADYGNNRVRVLDIATPVQKTSWGRVKSLYRGDGGGTTER